MKLNVIAYCYILISCFTIMNVTAQGTGTTTGKTYWGNSFEGAMFSTATGTIPSYSSSIGTLRFSYVINAGITYNYDVNDEFGLFTGLNIKNVGFIEKMGDSTVKHRSYNVGVPLGIKIGNISGHRYFFAGLDLEIPVNYKEKGFTSRNHKEKFSTWFSGRTPVFMPAIFAGISMKHSITLKLEYYLSNFMNPEFTDKGIKPYAGYDVHLIILSVGADMQYRGWKRKHNSNEPKTL